MLGPSAAAIAMARIRAGNASTMSTIRMVTSSNQPPRYPASAPYSVPKIEATTTTTAATGSDTRPP